MRKCRAFLLLSKCGSVRQARAVAIWACRQASSRLRRAGLSCVLVSASLLSSPAGAQNETSDPEREQIRLQLRIDTASSECPSADDVTEWVNQLAGRTYVRPDADAVVLVVVERATSGALSARVLRSASAAKPSSTDGVGGTENAAAEPTLLRELQDGSSCRELLRAAALSLAVMAVSKPPEATRAPVTPMLETDSPSNAAASESTPPSAPLAPSELERSPSPPRPADGIHSRPAQPGSAPASTRHERARASEGPTLGVEPYVLLRLAASSALGLNPGGALGASAAAALVARRWSVQASGEYRVSGQASARNAERVVGNSAGWDVGLCLRVTDAWRGCGVGGYQWLFAQGSGFGTDHSVTLATATLGAELGFELPVSRHLAFDFAAALLVPTRPITLSVLTPTQSDVWSMSPVAARLLLGLSLR